jgi:hypothetical protein
MRATPTLSSSPTGDKKDHCMADCLSLCARLYHLCGATIAPWQVIVWPLQLVNLQTQVNAHVHGVPFRIGTPPGIDTLGRALSR